MTIQITAPGIYDIPEDVYHADPCPEPSVSSTAAKCLLRHSPLHMWRDHPRLNPHHAAVNKATFDLGSAAHAELLGKGADCQIIDAADFRTKAAQNARDEAYEAGKTPLLVHQHQQVVDMAASARRQLQYHEEGCYFLDDGESEQVVAWRQDGVWNRAMFDRITKSRQFIYDYKTTTDAHPDTFMRQIVNMGYDVQQAHYVDGAIAVGMGEPAFRFIVQEIEPPYALCVQAITPAFLEIGRMKISRARQMFAWCLKHDKWPAFPNRTAYIDPPTWEKMKWLDESGDPLNSNHEDMQAMFRIWEQAQAPMGDAA